MKTKVFALMVLIGAALAPAFLFTARHALAAVEDQSAAAMKALDEYMAAFNSRDEKAWAATLNYPHVRMAGGEVKVWQTSEDYCADFDFDAFAKKYA